MAFCRLVFPLVLSAICLAQSVSSSGLVPVYLWGDLPKTSLKSNPLTKVTPEEFDSILKQVQELVEDPFFVIFIEETLSVEDLSHKNSDGFTSFPYLHANLGDSLYLPSVESPLRVLNKLADPEKVDHVKLTENGLSAEIEPESGKFLFINLKDAKEGESRADLLRRHNDFMEDMFTKLVEKYSKVSAVYTAHYPSWTVSESHLRVRRQAEASSNGQYDLNGLLMYVRNLTLKDGDKTVELTGMTESSTVFNDTKMETTLKFGDTTLVLNFLHSAGYWYFTKVEVAEGTNAREDLEPKGDMVYAIDGFSYRCADVVQYASVNASRDYTVTFNDLKIEPFFQVTGSNATFSESLNCVGFFSIPIWSGLFVVFILLAITFYGIMMMLDIRTMDRFDDPKGKTITINAQE